MQDLLYPRYSLDKYHHFLVALPEERQSHRSPPRLPTLSRTNYDYSGYLTINDSLDTMLST